MGFIFVVLDGVAFLDRQFLVALLFYQLARVLHDLFFDNYFHLCGASASYLSVGCPCHLHTQDREARPVNEH